jgi:hypothetical protein
VTTFIPRWRTLFACLFFPGQEQEKQLRHQVVTECGWVGFADVLPSIREKIVIFISWVLKSCVSFVTCDGMGVI